MKKYRVDCYKSRNTPLKKGDEVSVRGFHNRLHMDLVKADEIVKTSGGPTCKCKPPDFKWRPIFKIPFNETGTVVSVTETDTGFWFDMEVEEKK